MSSINSNIVLVGQRLVNNPQTGDSWEVEWKGTRTAVLALRETYRANGVNCRADVSGPVCTLTAIFPYDPTQPESSESPAERWELSNEQTPLDIFSHVDVAGESDRYALNVANGDKTRYRKEIEDAVEDGENKPAWRESGYPNAQLVYELMIRGVTSFETHRPILTRTRTYSARYASRRKLVVEYRPRVYYTSELVSTFSIPSIVSNQLPDDPPEHIEGTLWGWKPATDTLSVNTVKNMVDETLSFTFASWSWFLYKFSNMP